MIRRSPQITKTSELIILGGWPYPLSAMRIALDRPPWDPTLLPGRLFQTARPPGLESLPPPLGPVLGSTPRRRRCPHARRHHRPASRVRHDGGDRPDAVDSLLRVGSASSTRRSAPPTGPVPRLRTADQIADIESALPTRRSAPPTRPHGWRAAAQTRPCTSGRRRRLAGRRRRPDHVDSVVTATVC